MKKLKVYKENGEFVITEEGLKEGLQAYQSILDEY